MAGVRFLLQERYISVLLLGVMLAAYIIFLALALFLPKGASIFLRFLAFLQMFALSSTPFILTLLERWGLSEDAGLRFGAELGLHAARYKVFIRPLMGCIGVFCNAFAFRIVCNRSNRSFHVTNVHIAALARSSSEMNSY